MSTNLDLLAKVTDSKPVVEVEGNGRVTVTVHGAAAVFTATSNDLASAARKILDVLGA